jgi:hypothetical protein
MGLKTPQDYAQNLRDGRVTSWDGEAAEQGIIFLPIQMGRWPRLTRSEGS